MAGQFADANAVANRLQQLAVTAFYQFAQDLRDEFEAMAETLGAAPMNASSASTQPEPAAPAPRSESAPARHTPTSPTRHAATRSTTTRRTR